MNPSTTKKQISIIILTYNSESDIYDCLKSVYRHNDIGDALEIVIVDNKSLSVDIMFSNIKTIYGDDIILIKNNQNGGYGHGNNIGIKAASAPIIMIMNPDVRLIQPVFKIATETFEKGHIAMLGMTQLFSKSTKAVSFFLATVYSSSLILRLVDRLFRMFDFFIPNKMCFAGACFFIDKQIFEKVGLFDENIFMYCEESDVYYRIKKGGKLLYNNNLRYLHLAGQRKISINKLISIYKSKLYLCKKYNLNMDKLNRIEQSYTRYHLITESIKRNKETVQIYKEWSIILKKTNYIDF